MLFDRAIDSQFELEFEPTSAAASAARQAARRHLDGLPVPGRVAADAELIVSELTTNAVEQCPAAPIRLAMVLTEAGLSVTVANETTAVSPADRSAWTTDTDRSDGTLAERGWGLGIVEALTDGLWVDDADGWTSVGCLCRLDRPAR